MTFCMKSIGLAFIAFKLSKEDRYWKNSASTITRILSYLFKKMSSLCLKGLENSVFDSLNFCRHHRGRIALDFLFDNFLSDFHASDSGRKRKMRRCVLRSWISVWKMQKHSGDLDAVTLIKMLKWYAQMRMKAFCYSDSMADRLRHFRIYRKEGSHHLKDKMKFMLLASP